MRAVSVDFLRAIRGSHKMVARARVLTTYQEGVNPTGVEIPILGGNVQADADADVRATLELSTDGTRWDLSGLLTPYGNEVFVERGIVFGGGRREWVSLGYFRIYDAGQDRAPDGPVTLTGRDRMSAIIDARLEAPVQYPATATYGGVVDELVTAVYPEATIEWDDDLHQEQLGRSVVVERERYEFLRDLAQSRGKVFYVDHRGVFRIASPPDPSMPVFDVNHGRDGVLIEASRELSREGVFNAVVAYGEGTDTEQPHLAVARDANPASPTYYFGRFGQVPRFYSSPLITSAAQAASAAATLLRQTLGLPYNVDFTAVPNPALEPLDPLRVTYSDRDAPEIHVIRELTIPLLPAEPMTAVTREQTNPVVEVT
jgi:hypothetical protein